MTFEEWKSQISPKIEIFCENRLKEAFEEANSKNLMENLNFQLNRLGELAGEGTVSLMKDFAPFSFYFALKNERFPLEGGLIYHGTHDNGGDGGFPTYSVNLNAITGWSIHT